MNPFERVSVNQWSARLWAKEILLLWNLVAIQLEKFKEKQESIHNYRRLSPINGEVTVLEGEDDCKQISFKNKVIQTEVYFRIKLTNQLRIWLLGLQGLMPSDNIAFQVKISNPFGCYGNVMPRP